MTERLRAVLCAFCPDEAILSAEPLGRGHIHETFRLRAEGREGRRAAYVVQRVNQSVFTDPEALQSNLAKVTSHLREARRAAGATDLERRCLTPIPTTTGQLLHWDAAGEPWRAFPFIENTHSRESPRDPRQARDAARAFGGFVADLADLEPRSLVETIPHFHDLERRLTALESALRADPHARAAAIQAEIDEARRAADRLQPESALTSNALPRRVVHNDCKLNNLLFDDASDEALCVIDLDTVMSGSVLADFGELVRTAACPGAEDSRELRGIVFDRDVYRALAAGFIEGARGLLSSDEIDAFALAGPLLTLENAVRFLTDHLEGDRYFQIERPDHNLDRARAQLRRVQELFAGLPEAVAIVESLGPTPSR